MTQLNEAVARYHKIIDSEAYADLSWIEELHQKLKASHLMGGAQAAAPVLRPHLVTNRQYTNLVKAAESLHSAIERVEQLALATPALMSRMQLLPAEKMLASVDPGYSSLAVTSLLDTHLNNGTMQFTGYSADTPTGGIYGEALNNAFFDIRPMKEFRKRYNLTKVGSTKPLIQALLKAYKEFGGTGKKPGIAILEFKLPFQGSESSEYQLLAELFRREGFEAEVASPDQLEYRNGVLRKGQFTIDLVYRRVRASEFLLRFDLNHALVRAYRERKVCIVNSFRSELAQKKAMFDLLTDEKITSAFPLVERKAIRDFIPWTRVVAPVKTAFHDRQVDLPEFIGANRAQLVLRPNDENGDLQTYIGADLDDSAWERALKTSLRGGYVVQERLEPVAFTFPLYRFGSVEMREMHAEVHPHSYLGRVNGCSTWVKPVGSGFSSISGLAPTYILEAK